MLLDPLLVKSCVLSEAVVRRYSIKKFALGNFTGKHLRRSLFFDKAADWRPETLLKRKKTSAQIFSRVYFETSSDVSWLVFCCCCWLITFWCCCCWCSYHIKYLINTSLTPLDRRKAVFTLPAAILQNLWLRFT